MATPARVCSNTGEPQASSSALRNPPPLSELEGIAGISSAKQLSATQFRVLHTPDINPSGALLTLAERQGWQLEQLTPLQATLEEVFVKITDEEENTIGETS